MKLLYEDLEAIVDLSQIFRLVLLKVDFLVEVVRGTVIMKLIHQMIQVEIIQEVQNVQRYCQNGERNFVILVRIFQKKWKNYQTHKRTL